MNMTSENGYIIKDINTEEYYAGYNKWSNQLRKAKIYHDFKYAVKIRDDTRFVERDCRVFRICIFELEECEHWVRWYKW